MGGQPDRPGVIVRATSVWCVQCWHVAATQTSNATNGVLPGGRVPRGPINRVLTLVQGVLKLVADLAPGEDAADSTPTSGPPVDLFVLWAQLYAEANASLMYERYRAEQATLQSRWAGSSTSRGIGFYFGARTPQREAYSAQGWGPDPWQGAGSPQGAGANQAGGGPQGAGWNQPRAGGAQGGGGPQDRDANGNGAGGAHGPGSSQGTAGHAFGTTKGYNNQVKPTFKATPEGKAREQAWDLKNKAQYVGTESPEGKAFLAGAARAQARADGLRTGTAQSASPGGAARPRTPGSAQPQHPVPTGQATGAGRAGQARGAPGPTGPPGRPRPTGGPGSGGPSRGVHRPTQRQPSSGGLSR